MMPQQIADSMPLLIRASLVELGDQAVRSFSEVCLKEEQCCGAITCMK